MKEKEGTPEGRKLIEILYGLSEAYSASKAFNLTQCLDDVAILVMPNYRGYGIAQQFLRTRRIMCKEFKIPMTGAWMTGIGTQIAAAKDGWRAVHEIKYDDLANTHSIVFEDAPPTLKYMVAGPEEEQ